MPQRHSPRSLAQIRGHDRYKGTVCKYCDTNVRYTETTKCVKCEQTAKINLAQCIRQRRVRDAVAPTYNTPKGRAIRTGIDQYKGRPCPVCKNRVRFVDTQKCVACVENKVTYYSRHREEVMDKLKPNRLERMLKGSQRRAKEKGWEHNITMEDLQLTDLCPVLGTPMDRPSIDRFDNSKGYIKGNVRIISLRANSLKSDATVEEMEKVLAYMKGQPE